MKAAEDTLRIFLVDATGERPLGVFTVDGSTMSGQGLCGVRYNGSFALGFDGGASVMLVATVPAGIEMSKDLRTEEEGTRNMNFELTQAESDGRELKTFFLPGFGQAKLRIHLKSSLPKSKLAK